MNIQPKDTSRGHFYVSLAKSLIRIIAGVALIMAGVESFNFEIFVISAGTLLIAAEALGIVEELV
jgi:hypothetical protein